MASLVVITRPREEAEALSAALEGRGYRTLIEPMLDVVMLPTAVPPLEGYAALAFTSANGVRAFAMKSRERALPAYAVGKRTAGILRETGFRTIYDAGGDAGALASLIGAAVAPGSRLLHPSGMAVARDLGDLLVTAGIAVDRVPIYDTVPAQKFTSTLVEALYARTVEYVLFFSARTAQTFGTLVRKLGLPDMTTSTSALCLSGAVASAAADLPWREVRIAPSPAAAALLALLPTKGG